MKPSDLIRRRLGELSMLEGNDYATSQTVAYHVAVESKKILNQVVTILDELDERMKKLEANPPTP